MTDLIEALSQEFKNMGFNKEEAEKLAHHIREIMEILDVSKSQVINGISAMSTEQSSTEGVYHKWVYADTIAGMRYYRCTNCADNNIETLACENEVKWWKFCPRCGAKMFIKENEEEDG